MGSDVEFVLDFDAELNVPPAISLPLDQPGDNLPPLSVIVDHRLYQGAD